MDKRRESLQELRNRAQEGRKYEAMSNSEGWKSLEIEAQKMLEAFKSQGVSRELMGKIADHASVVGGYNALQSFLSIVKDKIERGKKADAKADELEKEIQDEDREYRKLQRV